MTVNSSITGPQRGVTCKFSYAMFLLGGNIAPVYDVDAAQVAWGVQAPCLVPERMQVRLMNQATTIPRSARDSAVGKDMAMPYGALL